MWHSFESKFKLVFAFVTVITIIFIITSSNNFVTVHHYTAIPFSSCHAPKITHFLLHSLFSPCFCLPNYYSFLVEIVRKENKYSSNPFGGHSSNPFGEGECSSNPFGEEGGGVGGNEGEEDGKGRGKDKEEKEGVPGSADNENNRSTPLDERFSTDFIITPSFLPSFLFSPSHTNLLLSSFPPPPSTILFLL